MTVSDYPGEEPQASIQVVERLAQILGMFAAPVADLRVAEVAAELGLGRSTAHRYMTSLAQVGLLKRDGDDGTYALGPKLIQLGAAALGRLRVVECAGPLMHRLAAEARQTVLLTVWGGHGPVIVRVQEDTTALVHTTSRVGRLLPLDTAQALVFLAYLPDQPLVARLLAQLPDDRRGELEREILTVRGRSVAISSRAFDGIRAIAAPVFDERGLIEATLGFVGTVNALPEAPDSTLVRALERAAEQLSGALGYAVAVPAATG
ncbi:MAG: IclR family transcriptional regulator [Dehalococcoidia bacterium]